MGTAMRIMCLLLAVVSLNACDGGAGDAGNTDVGPDDDTTVGAPADGGLSVPEAVETDATGPLTIQGFLIDDGGSVRLCQAAMESYPPQCGGASLEVEGVEVAMFEGATTEGDVTWVEQATLTGELHDGTLVVSASAQ